MITTPVTSLTVRKLLPCAPDVAFRAWTDPTCVAQWLRNCHGATPAVDYDLRVGGRYRIAFPPKEGQPASIAYGEFLRIEPPREIEYTWLWSPESDPDWKDRTIVRVTFAPVGSNQSEIVLTHDRFSRPDDAAKHTEGWSRIVDDMAAFLASA